LERDEAPERPLIFICHSLGGLIVKRAIVHAQQTKIYQQTLKAVYGLVFFATPHRGGNKALLGDVAASIARLVISSPKNSYLEALKSNSFFAEALRHDFQNRQDDFSIVTFYETRPTKAGIVSYRLFSDLKFQSLTLVNRLLI
jgi:protein SERAC1